MNYHNESQLYGSPQHAGVTAAARVSKMCQNGQMTEIHF